MSFLEKLQKTVRPRKQQGGSSSKSPLRCADLHEFELGIPLPPRQLLERQDQLRDHTQGSRSTDCDSDVPVACLYRLYRHVVLRQVELIEDEIDYFWSRKWEVASIPDPFDKHAERGAVLACCTFLLVEAFNGRIQLDLQDDDQSTRDRLEKPPRWALETEPLPYKLALGEKLSGSSVDLAPASRLFAIKNVQIDLTGLGLS